MSFTNFNFEKVYRNLINIYAEQEGITVKTEIKKKENVDGKEN